MKVFLYNKKRASQKSSSISLNIYRMMFILIITILILIFTAVFHYFGFATKDEYLFFNRRGAQSLFFLFLVLFFISSYLFWLEYRMPKTLALQIIPYHNATPSILPSLSLKNRGSEKWVFVTVDSVEDIKEFYLRKKNYNGWGIKSKEEEGLLIFEKGTVNLEIRISRKGDRSHILYTVEEKDIKLKED